MFEAYSHLVVQVFYFQLTIRSKTKWPKELGFWKAWVIMSGPLSLPQLLALALNVTPVISPSQASTSRKRKKPCINLIPVSSGMKIKKKNNRNLFILVFCQMWFLRLHFPTRNFHWISTWSISKPYIHFSVWLYGYYLVFMTVETYSPSGLMY